MLLLLVWPICERAYEKNFSDMIYDACVCQHRAGRQRSTQKKKHIKVNILRFCLNTPKVSLLPLSNSGRYVNWNMAQYYISLTLAVLYYVAVMLDCVEIAERQITNLTFSLCAHSVWCHIRYHVSSRTGKLIPAANWIPCKDFFCRLSLPFFETL